MLSQFAFSQTKSYEDTALDYFIDSIIPKHYAIVEDFGFSGNINNANPSYSICMKLDYINEYKCKSSEKIDVSRHSNFSRRIGLLKKIFQSWEKRMNLKVFKHYPLKEDFVVVIQASSKYSDDIFSILIKSDSREVINHCLTSYDF